MSPLKPDYKKIRQHIDDLTNQPWLSESQRFWPSHIFHFTDIRNAKNILTEECLFSRERLEQTGNLPTDIASPEIIKDTPQKWKKFVRLYFRPRTPMQYCNEGIRPKNKLKYDAHCPVPIVFVFDAVEILTRQSTLFSNGNLRTKTVNVKDTVDFYLSLPFEIIYHDTGFSRLSFEERSKVKFHRHAEVIVPDALDLSGLKSIVCRSHAEFETFIDLLPTTIRTKWSNKIFIDQRSLLFFREWIYIEKVSLSDSSIVLHFNPSSSSFPFHARMEIEEIKTNQKFVWEQKDFKVEKTLEFNLSNLEHPEHYRVSFFLDDNLAYQKTYLEKPEILF